MKQEDKNLLLKDLCARLPYGVMVNAQYKDSEGWKTENRKILGLYEDGQVYLDCVYTTIDCIKPYLRPMSNMTEEEKEDFYQNVLDIDIEDIRYDNDGKLPLPYNQKDKFIWFEDIYLDNAFAAIDWLNAHHFDFRNLIEKGLAIEVTEENDPYKE